MSGRDALRGFQYQILRTIEYAFACMGGEIADVASIQVEAASPGHVDSDKVDIVDFGLIGSSGQRILIAQIKSSRTDRNISAVQVVRQLILLVKAGDSASYLFASNQAPSSSAEQVARALNGDIREDAIIELLRSLVGASPAVARSLINLTAEERSRLTLCRVRFDNRSDEELRAALRLSVRTLRRRAGVRTGPASAGLVLGYLTAEILAAASGPNSDVLPIVEIWRILAIRSKQLIEAWGQRDWAHVSGVLPRFGDVSRADLVSAIRDRISGSEYQGAHCLSLVGRSGIGKSTVAVEYLAEFADDYDEIVWINANSETLLRYGFELVARRLGIELASDESDVTFRSSIHSALANSSRRWAIVFDNVPDRGAIRGWLPPSVAGTVLVTSTDRLGWHGPGLFSLEVGPMSSEQSILLLKARLLADEIPSAIQEESLGELAAAFGSWPLALELGANYMQSCGIPLERWSDVVGDLKYRALNDNYATPAGYPTTLIGALRATYQRLEARARSEEIAELSLLLVRYSAFLLERQIPIDILLMSATLDPLTAIELGVQGPHEWKVRSFPIEEVLRAAERDFLLHRDESLDLRLDSLKLSVQTNQIVQRVVRDLISESDPTGEIENSLILSLCFHLQSWISWFIDRDGVGAAAPLIQHAEYVADDCVRRSKMNVGVAVLLGNMATVLKIFRRYLKAAEYLRAEIDFLATEPDHHATIRCQAHIALASTLWEARAEGTMPDVATREICAILQSCAPWLHGASRDEPGVGLSTSLRAGLGLLEQLERRRDTIDMTDTRAAFVAAIGEVSGAQDPQLMERPFRLQQLWADGNYSEILRLCAEWMPGATHGSILLPTYLRMITEAHAALGNWDELHQALTDVRNVVRQQQISKADVGTTIVNSGLSCIIALLGGQNSEKSGSALYLSLRVADLAELVHGDLDAADQCCVLLLRAVDALQRGMPDAYDRYLAAIDFSALELVDGQRASVWREAYRHVAYLEPGDLERLSPVLDTDGPSGDALSSVRLSIEGALSSCDADELRTYNLVPDLEVEIGIDPFGNDISWSSYRDFSPCGGVVAGGSAVDRLHVAARIVISVVSLAQCEVFTVRLRSNGLLSAFDSVVKRFAVGAHQAVDVVRTLVSLTNESDDGPASNPRLFRGLLIVDDCQAILSDLSVMAGIERLSQRRSMGVVLIAPDGDLLHFGASLELRRNLRSSNCLILDGV